MDKDLSKRPAHPRNWCPPCYAVNPQPVCRLSRGPTFSSSFPTPFFKVIQLEKEYKKAKEKVVYFKEYDPALEKCVLLDRHVEDISYEYEAIHQKPYRQLSKRLPYSKHSGCWQPKLPTKPSSHQTLVPPSNAPHWAFHTQLHRPSSPAARII